MHIVNIIEIGKIYNKLTITSKGKKYFYSNGRGYWKVDTLCLCGNTRYVNFNNLIYGRVTACKKCSSTLTKHGMNGTHIHGVWISLRKRCRDIADKNYGGRGITYDSRWEKFENFYEDMGESYFIHKKNNTSTSIDRINVNGNYCKENCRWLTFREQANNKRTNIFYKGKSIADWCRELNLNYIKIIARISKHNWDIEKALELKK